MRRGPPAGMRGRASGTRRGLEVRGVAGAGDDLEPGAAGCPRRPTSARLRPAGSSAPAMTSVGAATSPSRSCSGSIAPCPAPRRLAASPAGRLRRRVRAEARGRGPAGARAWLANTGSRSQASTKASIPSRSSASAQRLVGGARGSRARRPVGEAGRRALEDEPPRPRRVVDRQPERDPRPERVAEDVRPARQPARSRIAARSSAGPLDAGAAGSAGMPERPWPGQVDGDDAGSRARTRSCAAPSSSPAR